MRTSRKSKWLSAVAAVAAVAGGEAAGLVSAPAAAQEVAGASCDAGSCGKCGGWFKWNKCGGGCSCLEELKTTIHAHATTPDCLGGAMHRILGAQVERGRADHFVIYDNEWLGDSATPGPFGRGHLERIAKRVGETSYPVVVVPTGNPAIDAPRRRVVVTRLALAGLTDADQRVVLGYSEAEGLYGEEAVMLYPLMLSARFRGAGFGRGIGGLGGFGGGLGGGFGLGGLGGGFGLGGLGLGAYGAFGYAMPFNGGFGGIGLGGIGGYGGGYRGLGY